MLFGLEFRQIGPTRTAVRPLHPIQEAIIRALDGKALQTKRLIAAVEKGLDQGQFFRDYLNPLRESGAVENARGIGFYRPDAPPPSLRHQRAR